MLTVDRWTITVNNYVWIYLLPPTLKKLYNLLRNYRIVNHTYCISSAVLRDMPEPLKIILSQLILKVFSNKLKLVLTHVTVGFVLWLGDPVFGYEIQKR